MRKLFKARSREEVLNMPKDENALPVTMADFQEALDKIKPSVSKTDIVKYEQWLKEYGSA